MRDWQAIGGIILTAMIYATARYVVFGEWSAEHIPLYVGNKAISVAGLVVIGVAPFFSERERRKSWGVIGFVLLLAHAAMSLLIFTPHYYRKFFLDSQRLSVWAESSMLAGVAGMVLAGWLFVVTVSAKDRPPGRNGLIPGAGRGVLACGALHVLFMGAGGWRAYPTWPGYLPPITLLSFIVAVTLLVWRWVASSRKRRTW